MIGGDLARPNTLKSMFKTTNQFKIVQYSTGRLLEVFCSDIRVLPYGCAVWRRFPTFLVYYKRYDSNIFHLPQDFSMVDYDYEADLYRDRSF